ncbi:relaxase/mobilization nuclease domain-containing protein [Fusobacterium gastrosuis]|uniref:relaxase/mobilization nuclease domain-containing protein n=1 Tax=Fusobacterium gastrosuis TaxID=1755100 RepID=UPI002A9960CD|nr:relaxase/mobilization nuclease domain-containing protein [Fusobacterium gastrosuis]
MGGILKAVGGGNSHACNSLEDYLNQEEKVQNDERIGINCDPESFNDDFRLERAKHLIDKDARAYLHYVVSYRDTDGLTNKEILEQTKKLVEGIEKFKGHQIAIICHSDREHHPHTHVVVNAVNSETGKKLAFNKKDLEKAKELLIELDKELGIEQELKIREGYRSQSMKSYKALEKGELGDKNIWKVAIKNAVLESMEKAKSKDEFIKSLELKGYSVEWSDNRKHIVVSDSEGNKRRLSNIEKEYPALEGKLTKEGLEKRFSLNAIKENGVSLEELKVQYKVKSLKDLEQEKANSWKKEIKKTKTINRGGMEL